MNINLQEIFNVVSTSTNLLSGVKLSTVEIPTVISTTLTLSSPSMNSRVAKAIDFQFNPQTQNTLNKSKNTNHTHNLNRVSLELVRS